MPGRACALPGSCVQRTLSCRVIICVTSKGPNYTLNLEYDGIVEAPSFEEALRPHTDWPITESYDHATATAWNPGTCMYYQEMWEAALLPDADQKQQS